MDNGPFLFRACYDAHMFKRGNAGFTLIELLVVIAIIGILSSVVLASLTQARAKGRDANRIAAIKQLQLAIELFYDACSEFPATITAGASNGCPSGTTLGSFISAIPTDPGDGSAYRYDQLASGSSYELCANLETANVALNNDNTTVTAGGNVTSAEPDTVGCTGSANQFSFNAGP